MARRAALAAVIAACGLLQAQEPVFDAAIIKPNRSSDSGTSIGQRPGGQYIMTNGTIAMLLLNAYGPENGELVGAPDWVSSERYDLQATANATTTSETLRRMLRALLVDRLELQAHLEPREQPVYFLVKARPDGRPGPALVPAPRDCAAVAAARSAGLPIPVLQPPANGAPPCGLQAVDGELRAGGLTMDVLARNLGRRAGRVVFDRTGIAGYFDFTLTFQQGTVNPDGPSFFTALQEQLGLKLEGGRAPLQTLIVDHIERPVEN